jgi:hypothetical protein
LSLLLYLTSAERDDLQICFVNEIASDEEQLEEDININTTVLAAKEIARLGVTRRFRILRINLVLVKYFLMNTSVPSYMMISSTVYKITH